MAAPRLTVRAMAEMLRRPQSDVSRKLRAQKYPKQQPQAIQIPYYQSVAAAVRNYYRKANSASILVAARNRAMSIANKSRRTNVIRVLDNFRDSPFARRTFDVQANQRYTAKLGKVELKLSSDMQATESGEFRVVYFGYGALGIDAELAILQAEIAHWVLRQNQVSVRIDQVEVMDLSTGKRHSVQAPRATTVRALAALTARIAALWDSI